MAATTAKPGSNGDGQNGWVEYRRLVLAELERLSSQVAMAQAQGVATQLAVSQAVNDTKQILLEKLRDTMSGIEDDYEKKIRTVETFAERRVKDLEVRHTQRIEDLKREIDKNEKNVKEAEKKLERNEKEVVGLKAKAIMLGALAGFFVAIGAVVATLYVGK